MNWDRFDAYLEWVRFLIVVSMLSVTGLAITKPLGWEDAASYFFVAGFGAVFLLLALAIAVGVDSLDFRSRHL